LLNSEQNHSQNDSRTLLFSEQVGKWASK